MPPKDLSQQPGNPTSYIHDHYKELMDLAEHDPEAVAQQIIQAAQEMVGTGLSELNFRKLKMRVMKAVQRGTFGVQKYVGDYMLRGMGHGDIKTGGRGAYESAEAIGSLITEDPDSPRIEWSRDLIFIESVLKEHGLELIVEEPHRGYNISQDGGIHNFEHDEYDGAPDSGDSRSGWANSRDEATQEIDQLEDESVEGGGVHPGRDNEQGYETLNQVGDYQGVLINRSTRGTRSILQAFGLVRVTAAQRSEYLPLPVIVKDGQPLAGWNGREWILPKSDMPIRLGMEEQQSFDKLCTELGVPVSGNQDEVDPSDPNGDGHGVY